MYLEALIQSDNAHVAQLSKIVSTLVLNVLLPMLLQCSLHISQQFQIEMSSECTKRVLS